MALGIAKSLCVWIMTHLDPGRALQIFRVRMKTEVTFRSAIPIFYLFGLQKCPIFCLNAKFNAPYSVIDNRSEACYNNIKLIINQSPIYNILKH